MCAPWISATPSSEVAVKELARHEGGDAEPGCELVGWVPSPAGREPNCDREGAAVGVHADTLGAMGCTLTISRP